MEFIILGVLAAIVAFLITKFLGKQWKGVLGFIGMSILLLPIVFELIKLYFVTPENLDVAASEAILAIMNYFVEKLPQVLLADIGGHLSGALIGFFTQDHTT